MMTHQSTFLGLAAVLLTSVLTGCFSESPESAVKNFHYALEKGEISKAKSYMSNRIVGTVGDEKLTPGLTGASEEITQCGGIKDIKVELEGKGEIRSGISTITYKGDCPAKDGDVNLIKEDGKWKISANK